jgi:hypothetical protein
VLALEEALGVSAGHDTTRKFVAKTISGLERQAGVSPRGRTRGRST